MWRKAWSEKKTDSLDAQPSRNFSFVVIDAQAAGFEILLDFTSSLLYIETERADSRKFSAVPTVLSYLVIAV